MTALRGDFLILPVSNLLGAYLKRHGQKAASCQTRHLGILHDNRLYLPWEKTQVQAMKLCRLFLVVVMLGSFSGTSTAEARTFTNTAGKTVDAELIGLNDKTAVLKLDNGSKAKVPLSSLCKEDQAYINDWWEKNKNRVSDSDVRLSISKKITSHREPRSKDGKKNNNKSKKTSTVYTCTLSSYCQKTINNIKADYTVYKNVSSRGEGGSGFTTEKISKTATIDRLESNKSAEFETSGVECVTTSQKAKKGKGSAKRESIMGIVVTLSVDGKEFLKQSYPENLLRKLEDDEKRESRKK